MPAATDDAAAPIPRSMDDQVREALEVPRLTVTRMAVELGIPRATLEAYRLGTRRMPAAVRLRLAVYLEQHAAAVRRLAEVLRG